MLSIYQTRSKSNAAMPDEVDEQSFGMICDGLLVLFLFLFLCSCRRCRCLSFTWSSSLPFLHFTRCSMCRTRWEPSPVSPPTSFSSNARKALDLRNLYEPHQKLINMQDSVSRSTDGNDWQSFAVATTHYTVHVHALGQIHYKNEYLKNVFLHRHSAAVIIICPHCGGISIL